MPDRRYGSLRWRISYAMKIHFIAAVFHCITKLVSSSTHCKRDCVDIASSRYCLANCLACSCCKVINSSHGSLVLENSQQEAKLSTVHMVIFTKLLIETYFVDTLLHLPGIALPIACLREAE